MVEKNIKTVLLHLIIKESQASLNTCIRNFLEKKTKNEQLNSSKHGCVKGHYKYQSSS